MKKLNSGYLGNGLTFWEEGSNDYQAHISYDRKVTIYDKTLSPENVSKINKMAESGNSISDKNGEHPHLILKPLNESKYVQINPMTKEEMFFSIENICGEMYKCIENYIFKVKQHPCLIHKNIFLYV